MRAFIPPDESKRKRSHHHSCTRQLFMHCNALMKRVNKIKPDSSLFLFLFFFHTGQIQHVQTHFAAWSLHRVSNRFSAIYFTIFTTQDSIIAAVILQSWYSSSLVSNRTSDSALWSQISLKMIAQTQICKCILGFIDK